MTLRLILNLIFLALVTLSCLLSFAVLLLIVIHRRPALSNISTLLTSNTYISILCFSVSLLDIGIRSLYGHVNPTMSFAGRWCEIRAYFPHVCFCAYYYSFVAQAVFRLFRVVFYRTKILQSFGVFLLAIVIQWSLSFVLVVPHVVLGDFQYQPFDYNCWISFKNLRAMFFATLVIYGGPLCTIFGIYIYILRFVRQTAHVQRKQQRSNKRDVIVLKRIVILLLFLVLIGVPTLGVLFGYVITGYLTPLAYDIQAVNIALGLVTTSVTLIVVTPRIRSLFQSNGQRQPCLTQRETETPA